jgi:hypothetical protein
MEEREKSNKENDTQGGTCSMYELMLNAQNVLMWISTFKSKDVILRCILHKLSVVLWINVVYWRTNTIINIPVP